MTYSQIERQDGVPEEVCREISRICLDFCNDWRAGKAPRIEDFLKPVPPNAQQFLLFRLLLKEVEFCYAEGRTSSREEYLSRFQGDQAIVDAAFEYLERVASSNNQLTDTVTFQSKVVAAKIDTDAGSPFVGMAWNEEPSSRAESERVPKTIGRFAILRRLGQGGFGTVYLAQDPELDRKVALKLPRPERFSSTAELDEFLAEAKTAARLKHSGIVTMYDVVRCDQGMFIVQEYVEGKDLRQFLHAQKTPVAAEKAASLLISIADAVAYAHEAGIVHRDLKPENILLDTKERPLVADFGLAIHETLQRRKRGDVSGSPLYMSPEQVRGESHRLDGRSDLWSLGVIFYELVTGRLPFFGVNRREIFDEILFREPVPVRQRRPDIPAELDRICQKCLAKRVLDRYSSAHDLIEDLQHWQQKVDVQRTNHGVRVKASAVEQNHKLVDASINQPPLIIPKGLLPYDSEDADFFLDLLQGPHDRESLPASIRFWKTRIEQLDSNRTFSLGLMYGPSGCGKSSLMRAGVLPRLSDHVIPIYVEASSEDTEVRIHQSVRRIVPGFPAGGSLAELLAAVREDQRLLVGKKVLLVLDQFEQWLHSHSIDEDLQLVPALRHCDGGRLQALVMVRDDFWLAVSRFLYSLEMRIAEGENSTLVDLFDMQHAQKILAMFGQAYGKLSHNQSDWTGDQNEFLRACIAGLAENRKVSPVRLAILAEMLKNRQWTSQTLQQVGGIDGIGVTFLQEIFDSRLTPPELRSHTEAIQKLFWSLLPQGSIEIKSARRSLAQLCAAAGFLERPRDFKDLIDVLDRKLHLITPVDMSPLQLQSSEGVWHHSNSQTVTSTGSDISPAPAPQAEFYQLTHDYLVPSLRDWLTRKQRETRRGQAELKLADRATSWNLKPEDKQLPTLWEWLAIYRHTRPSSWREIEAKMMKRATKLHLRRSILGLTSVCLVLVAILFTRSYFSRRELEAHVKGLIGQLMSAEPMRLPQVLSALDAHQELTYQQILPILNTQAPSLEQKPSLLHARIFAVRNNPRLVEPLLAALFAEKLEYLPVIRDRLRPHAQKVKAPLSKLLSDAQADPEMRFRAAVALLGYTSSHDTKFWEETDWGFIAQRLVGSNPEVQPFLRHELQSAKSKLLDSLERISADSGATESELLGAANALADFAEEDTERLARILAVSNPAQYSVLLPPIAASNSPKSLELLTNIASKQPQENLGSTDRINFGKRRAGAAISLLRLGLPTKALPVFEFTDDPEAMTQFIFGFRSRGVRLEDILECFDVVSKAQSQMPSDRTRYALLLALGEFTWEEIPASRRDPILALLTDWYANDPSSGVHGAAAWLLRHWGHREIAREIEQTPVAYSPNRQWFTLAVTVSPSTTRQSKDVVVDSEGIEHAKAAIQGFDHQKTFYYTFVVFPRGRYWIGSVEDEPNRSEQLGREMRHPISIDRPFAILDREITFAEFIAFWPGFEPLMQQYQQQPECAGFGASWYECVSFCRWLGEQHGLSETDQAYPAPEGLDPVQYPRESHTQANWAPRDWPCDPAKIGFRLPTEAEWESATRAGTRTTYGFGSDSDWLHRFGWFNENSHKKVHLPQELRPGLRGLFDLHGNLHEWNHDWYADYGTKATEGQPVLADRSLRAVRGGSWSHSASYCRATSRGGFNPSDRDDFLGMRIAVSLPDVH